MTVKELKEQLEGLPDDAGVFIPYYDPEDDASIVPVKFVTDDLPTETDYRNSVMIF